MNNICIIIEGIDAVGKTTLAKLLALKMDGIYYKTPPESFRRRCVNIDSSGVIYSEERLKNGKISGTISVPTKPLVN